MGARGSETGGPHHLCGGKGRDGSQGSERE